MIFQLIYIEGKIKFTYLSNSVIKLYGITPEEGMADATLIYNKIHEDDIGYLTKAEAESHKTLSVLRAEVRIKDIDGGVRWSTFVSTPRILDDGSTCWDGIEFVTTERKLAQDEIKRQKEIAEQYLQVAEVILVALDNKACVTLLNRKGYNFLGYQEGELIGKNWFEICLPDVEYKSIYEEYQNIMAGRIDSFEYFEKYVITMSGEKKYIAWHNTLLKNKEGKITGLLSSGEDITEKKETERRILQAIIEAEERERNYFAREIHDGLGPLLSTIRLYLQWLNKPDLKASKDDLIAKADLVIEDAITSAKEISHKLSPQILINFGLTPAVNNFIGRITGTTQTIINFESNIEVRLKNDIEVTLYRVITECLNNSLKYANAKNIELKLNLSEHFLHMIYTDNGIGFNVSEKVIMGKGQGLNNIQNRVTTLGGTFSIRSKINRGVQIEVQINT
jgi:PAS domain S-box-containing protein